MADKSIAFMCQLSGKVAASTSWNGRILSSPVQGLLYLYYRLVKRNENGKRTYSFSQDEMLWPGFEAEYLYSLNQRLLYPTPFFSFFSTTVVPRSSF